VIFITFCRINTKLNFTAPFVTIALYNYGQRINEFTGRLALNIWMGLIKKKGMLKMNDPITVKRANVLNEDREELKS